MLTNIGGIHALTAWRRYNAGAVVEQRIEELAQLSAGRTAVGKTYFQFLRGEPVRQRLLAALRTLDHAMPPPVPA